MVAMKNIIAHWGTGDMEYLIALPEMVRKATPEQINWVRSEMSTTRRARIRKVITKKFLDNFARAEHECLRLSI